MIGMRTESRFESNSGSRWRGLFSVRPAGSRPEMQTPTNGIPFSPLGGPAMAHGGDTEKAPTLFCNRCRRPMEFLALLPAIANLPAAYAYRCIPCLRVETIVLG